MILVTGHKGFIGRNLVKNLQEHNKEVYGFDAIDGDPIELANQVPWNKIEMIYHQGAISNTTELDVLKIHKWNVQSSIQIMEKAIEYGIPIHYASSGSVYGNSIADHKTYDYNPLNYYAISKLTIDIWMRENMSRFTSPVVGFRYFNVYGADERKNDYCTSPVYKFSEQSKTDGVIKIFKGSHDIYRDFVWVGDVIKIITKEHKSGIYDVGSSAPISFLDVAEIVSEKYGSTIKIIPFPEIIRNKYQRWTRARPHINHQYMSVKDFVQNIL